MANYTIDKTTTLTKVKAAARAEVMEVIMAALIANYGEDNVGMIRTGSGNSEKNDLGIRVGTVTEGSEVYDLCVSTNASAKEPMDRKTAKKSYAAFDFEAARNAYESYLIDKAASEKEKAEKKEKKIAADTKRREESSEDIVDF